MRGLKSSTENMAETLQGNSNHCDNSRVVIKLAVDALGMAMVEENGQVSHG